MLQPLFIKATSLSDAWFQTLYRCVETGRTFTINRGSFEGQKRLEFDFITIHITHPSSIPLLPKVNPVLGFPDPVEEEYLDDYLPYLMTGEEKQGESYTYGQRICKCDFQYLPDDYKKLTQILVQEKEVWENRNILIEENARYFINQMEMMIWTYKNKGHRNNQMILQVGQPTDMVLLDPPCLRHIDTRIQDGKLHFFPYFRSWDLFGGFPANLAAIEMMKQYCAEQIGVENGEIIASSKGLHIYDYVFEIAEAIRGRSMDEFREMS
ncbi:MAG: thymidylate synthase [Deltaproteobacteria bacterium]|nr:MAG: thymidylate synthase [Deltaproteobacteria bacterium]